MRQEFPTIDTYGTVTPDGRPTISQRAVGLTGATDQYETPAFGTYHRDTQEKENLRDFYSTLEAVPTVTPGQNATPIIRTAPISEHEINLLRQGREEQKQKKWEQYWWAQTDPGRPWTMTEVAKVDPSLVARKMDAIKTVSQFALDNAIIKHIGHGGDPRLAQLQYMVDQGMMDHMPHLLTIDAAQYRRGPLSIWQVLDPGGQSTDTTEGRYDDKKVYMARTAYADQQRDARAYIDNAGVGNPLETMYGNRDVPNTGPLPPPVIPRVAPRVIPREQQERAERQRRR
jgi:hypothetical protein